MGSQIGIFRLLLLILLIANANGGCGCSDNGAMPIGEDKNCSCFGSINSCILAVLLMSACSCGDNNGSNLLG